MKRIFALILLGLFASTAVFAFQDNYEYTTRMDFQTYVSDNLTGTYKVTYVSKTTIIPREAHILGYAIFPLSTNSENIVALNDMESTDPYKDEAFIDEAECAAASTTCKWFAYPKSIKTQLNIRQGGQTRVIVYYDTK